MKTITIQRISIACSKKIKKSATEWLNITQHIQRYLSLPNTGCYKTDTLSVS